MKFLRRLRKPQHPKPTDLLPVLPQIKEIVSLFVEGDLQSLMANDLVRRATISDEEEIAGFRETLDIHPGILRYPDEGWESEIYILPATHDNDYDLEFPLWTVEEGKSDLWLILLWYQNTTPQRVKVWDLRLS